MRTSRSHRGMTLIELMISVAIGAIVMAGIASAFIAQARQYQALAGRRDTQASARSALSFVEDKLRLAGYGVDPNLAVVAYDSYNASADAADPSLAYPDAVIVHERDPNFQRTIASNGASAGSLNVTVALGQPLLAGQILLAICSGAQTYAYVTVASTANAGDTSINISGAGGAGTPVTRAGARFNQPAALDQACFDTGEAMVVKVDRFAFFVGSYDDDGVPATANNPYLMMHRGIDVNGDGAIDRSDAMPIAPGIEQMQVAYVMNSTPATGPVVVGANSTVPAGFNANPPAGDAWDTAATRPSWKDPYDADKRRTDNPANIRQVRLTLVSRSDASNPELHGDDMMDTTNASWAQGSVNGTVVWRQLENLATNPAADFKPIGGGYVRSVMRVAVTPKNLLMRSQFLPPTFGG